MKTEVLVDQLKSLDCAKCPRRIECCSADGDVCVLFGEAADRLIAQQGRIAQLEAELIDERYRHDRVQDFEVAEAQELAKLRQERRWNPVGERLPEVRLWYEDDDDGVHTRYYRSAPVAVCWDRDCCKAEYHESRDVIDGQETNVQACWLSHEHGELDCVTHWAQLLEPPEVLPDAT